MSMDSAGTGERPGFTGRPATPREAATVIIVRGGDEALEVLLVRRSAAARFAGGAWVFPGGVVDRDEGEGEAAHRAAAIREVREETGIALGDPAALVRFSRWITPAELPIRFDTHFFLAPVPPEQEARVDGSEIVDHRWCAPQDALRVHARGEMPLIFPTIKHLEQLARFGDAAEVLAFARRCDVRPVHPGLLLRGEVARLVLRGHSGP